MIIRVRGWKRAQRAPRAAYCVPGRGGPDRSRILGTDTWDRHLEPTLGTNTWDQRLGPTLGTNTDFAAGKMSDGSWTRGPERGVLASWLGLAWLGTCNWEKMASNPATLIHACGAIGNEIIERGLSYLSTN